MGVVIKKSKEEIQRLIDIIRTELENLPERNAFGDSNDDAKKECKVQIQELESALVGQLPDDNSEVYAWLVDKWSMLNDYLS